MAPLPLPHLVSADEFRDHWFDAAVDVYLQAMNRAPRHIPHRRELFRTHLSEPGWSAVVAGRPLAGFAYGFHCDSGQWWHDQVEPRLRAEYGQPAARAWLANAYCLAELHVRPRWQGRGLGRALTWALLRDRAEETVLLSTPERSSGARAFYAALGYTELLVGMGFVTSTDPYLVLGRRLR
ncbi:MAG: GNAT family N-acetyltransferase [Streptosporangiales bacterium]